MSADRKELQRLGVQITYSTGEVAEIFGKTRQWVLWSLTEGRFVGKDGQPLLLERNAAGGYTWTGESVKYAAVSLYQRKKISIDELKRIIRKVIRDTGAINGRY